MRHPCSKLSEEFLRGRQSTFLEAFGFAVGLFVADLLHILCALFQGLLMDGHVLREVGLQCLCFWLAGTYCMHFFYDEIGLGME